MSQLPSWIKPCTAEAYNHAYTFLYCRQPREIRNMLDKAKDDDAFATRFTSEFLKEVRRMAEYEMPWEDLKALERQEKVAGIHPSQHKLPVVPPPTESPKVEQTNLDIPETGNPS